MHIGKNFCKLVRPFIFYIQRDGIRQKALEQLRRSLRRIKEIHAILFRHAQEISEAREFIHYLSAQPGRRFQKVVKDQINELNAKKNQRTTRGQRLRQKSQAGHFPAQKRYRHDS